MMFSRRTILTFSMFVPLLLNAQIGLPQEEADKHHTALLVSKINQQTLEIVPRQISGYPRELKIQIQFPGKNQYPKFNINLRRNPIQITLPHHFSSWAFRKENILPFVHTYLSARTGSRILLGDVWISAAILHEIYEPGALYQASGYGNFPYARTMLAHGAAPELNQILNSTYSDFYGKASSAAKMEWCAILLKNINHRELLTDRLLSSRNRKSPAERFQQIVYPRLAGSSGTPSRTPEIPIQDWFVNTAMKDILGRGIPAASPWIEAQFSEIMEKIRPCLKQPSDKPAGKLSREAIRNLMNAEYELNQLGIKSTEQIALKLFRCVRDIRQFRMNPNNPEHLAVLQDSTRQVYTVLSERNALESFLRDAEKRLIPPGSRWALTLNAITPQKPDIPLLIRANTLLDHFEKEY